MQKFIQAVTKPTIC